MLDEPLVAAQAPPAAQALQPASISVFAQRALVALAGAPQDHAWDVCPDCNAPTEESAASQEMVCPLCSRMFARPTVDETAILGGTGALPGARPAPPLRMVGEDSSRHQKVLDRSAVTNTTEAACMDIYRELVSYNHEFVGKKFAPAVLQAVAETYAEKVRTVRVNRSQNKQAILANLLFRLGQELGEPRPAPDCARLLKLRNKGLASGAMHMRDMGVCIELLNGDQVTPWLNDTFRRMGIVLDEHLPPSQELTPTQRSVVAATSAEREAVDRLRRAALELLEAGVKNFVGIQMQPRTRAICSAYVVLRRSVMAGLLPAGWGFVPGGAADSRGTLEWLSRLCDIRTQTMTNYIRVLHTYHSQFRPLFQKYGMWCEAAERL